MKIRSNYVSNSSASSYIIGVGTLKPEYKEEVLKLIKSIENNSKGYSLEPIKLEFVENDKEISVESFNGDFISTIVKAGDLAVIIDEVVETWFTNEEDNEAKQAELDDFSDEIIKMINNNEWFEKLDYTYGEGYNG